MKKNTAEKWMSLALDGELSERRLRRLEAYLARAPADRATRRSWEELGAQLRALAPPAGKTPEAAWNDVRRTLRLEAHARTRDLPAHGALHSPLRWAAAIMGVAAACIALVFLVHRPAAPSAAKPAAAEPGAVEWVETDLPDATPMVYQDAETGWTVIWVMANEENNDHAGS